MIKRDFRVYATLPNQQQNGLCWGPIIGRPISRPYYSAAYVDEEHKILV